jgi:FMN phosphatase YigB (HAD superfamily)
MRIADPYPPSVETGHLDPAAQPPRIGAVLFDFAHTTFRPIDSGEWLRRAAEVAGQPLDENSITRLVAKLDEAWALPEVVRAQTGRDVSIDAHRRAALTWIHAVPELTPLGGVLYEVLMATDSWLPYPDTGPVLAELARHRVPVGVVSDIAWDIRAHFAAYGMQELVGAYALSYEHGLQKPDPRLFGYACAELGVDPRSTLMVGDSPARDGGAIGAGLRAYILPAERRVGVRGLADILGLLGLPGLNGGGDIAVTGVNTTARSTASGGHDVERGGPHGPNADTGPPPRRAHASHAQPEPDGKTTMEFTIGPAGGPGQHEPSRDQGFPAPGQFPPTGGQQQARANGPSHHAEVPRPERPATPRHNSTHRFPNQSGPLSNPLTAQARASRPAAAGMATATVTAPVHEAGRVSDGAPVHTATADRLGLRLRQVEPGDHGAILAGIAAGWSGPAGFGEPDPWLLLPRMLLETAAASSLVVTANGEVWGYLVGLLPDGDGAEAYVHLLGVAPVPDASRIAQGLLDRFAELAVAAGLVRARLAVPPGDMALLGHCLAARFAIQPGTGTVAGTPVVVDYDGPGQHRVVLVRQLTASVGQRGGRHRGA